MQVLLKTYLSKSQPCNKCTRNRISAAASSRKASREENSPPVVQPMSEVPPRVVDPWDKLWTLQIDDAIQNASLRKRRRCRVYFSEIINPLRSALSINPTCRPCSSKTAPFSFLARSGVVPHRARRRHQRRRRWLLRARSEPREWLPQHDTLSTLRVYPSDTHA